MSPEPLQEPAAAGEDEERAFGPASLSLAVAGGDSVRLAARGRSEEFSVPSRSCAEPPERSREGAPGDLGMFRARGSALRRGLGSARLREGRRGLELRFVGTPREEKRGGVPVE